MLNIISAYLHGTEFDLVDTAQDGKEAVEKFQQLKPDLVLLDLVMPGQSGQDTLRQLIDLRPDARVAIVSSLGTEQAVEECKTLGARGFLKKPFSKDDLFVGIGLDKVIDPQLVPSSRGRNRSSTTSIPTPSSPPAGRVFAESLCSPFHQGPAEKKQDENHRRVEWIIWRFA